MQRSVIVKEKKIYTKTALLLAFLLLLIDQATKYLTRNFIKPGQSKEIINGFFRLSYVQNRGATFGLFQGATYVIAVIAFIVMIILLVMIINKKFKNNFLLFSISLILSGGLGNIIDRIKFGYVVDMLDFYGIWPYVFNFADCCIVIGVILLLVYEIRCAIIESKQKDNNENA